MSIATTYANYSPDWWTPPEWSGSSALSEAVISIPVPVLGRRVSLMGLILTGCRQPTATTLGRAVALNDGGRSFSKKTSTWAGCRSFGVPSQSSSSGIWSRVRLAKRVGLSCPSRIGFIWGGATKQVGTNKKTGEPIIRHHGERAKSPGNWTAFWTNCRPARPPQDCRVITTDPTSFEYATGLVAEGAASGRKPNSGLLMASIIKCAPKIGEDG